MCKKEDNNIKRKYGGCHRSPHDDPNELRMSQLLLNKAPADLPSNFDLLDKCPKNIRDQKDKNICGGMAGSVLRQMHLSDVNKQLSPAFLYWKAREMHNETQDDCGVYLKDIVEVLRVYGIPEESYMRFDSDAWNQTPSKEAYENAKFYKINSYINMDNGIAGIKSYLYTRKKPVIFGMEIYEGFIKETGKNGFAPIPKKDEKPIDGHSALIVGYKDNTLKDNIISLFNHKRSKYGYFIVLNSYGRAWGNKGGFFLMPYEMLLEHKAYDFYVITTKDNGNYQDEIINK